VTILRGVPSRTRHCFNLLQTLFDHQHQVIAGSSMIYNRCRRKLDPFSLLLIAVALGMSATLAYQINVYSGVDAVPIAKETPSPSGVGG
jgi:hypothetical protein